MVIVFEAFNFQLVDFHSASNTELLCCRKLQLKSRQNDTRVSRSVGEVVMANSTNFGGF